MEDKKKNYMVRLSCPKCKEIRDCYLIDFSPERNKITVRCKECGTTFMQFDAPRDYNTPQH